MQQTPTTTRSAGQRIVTPQLPTGKWEHPALQDVLGNMRRYGLNETTLQRLLSNIAAWILMEIIKYNIHQNECVRRLSWATYIWQSLRILFLVNITLAGLSITRSTETEPPLTPEQRKLMGMDSHPRRSVSMSSATEVTPPRYRRGTPTSSPRESPLQRPLSASPSVQSIQSLLPASAGATPSPSPAISASRSVSGRYTYHDHARRLSSKPSLRSSSQSSLFLSQL